MFGKSFAWASTHYQQEFFDKKGKNIMYEISIGSTVLDENPELRDVVYGDLRHDEDWMDF